jgi:hypothetical protein
MMVMFLPTLLQECERMCLVALCEAITAEGLGVSALIHDGLLVQRQQGYGTMLPAEQLRRWERDVEAATGFSVRLAEKPMEDNPLYAVLLDQAPSSSPTSSLQQASTPARATGLGGLPHLLNVMGLHSWVIGPLRRATSSE